MRPDKNLAGNLNVDEEKMAGNLNVDEEKMAGILKEERPEGRRRKRAAGRQRDHQRAAQCRRRGPDHRH